MEPRARRIAPALLLLGLGFVPAASRLASSLATAAGTPLAFALSRLLPLPESIGGEAGARESRLAFFEAEARALLPADALRASRGFLLAGVVSREDRGAILVLDAGADDGVPPGAAVIAGDALVGFVERALPRSARVRSLRSASFRAAARAPGTLAAPAFRRLVVAGTGAPFLSVEVVEGEGMPNEGAAVVCAAPPLEGGEGMVPGPDADGFLLGIAEAARGGTARVRVSVDPAVPAAVLVVVPAGPSEVVRIPARDGAERREEGRVVAAIDLAPGRRSLLLVGPAARGARPGDAIVEGESLVGVAAAVSRWSARVRLVEDPGFAFEGAFRTEAGNAVPLGVVRAARGGGGAFEPSLRPPDGTPGRGTLHAAGGGIPRGLLLGPARLEGARVVLGFARPAPARLDRLRSGE